MHDLDDYEEDDGFGPGSDLVLSLLAIAILLLGITGASRQISFKKDWTQTAPVAASPEKLAAELLAERTKTAELSRTLEAVTQDAATARVQLQTAQDEKAAMDAGLRKMAERLVQTEQKNFAEVTASEKLAAEALAARTKAAELARTLETVTQDASTARVQLQTMKTEKEVMDGRLKEMTEKLLRAERQFAEADRRASEAEKELLKRVDAASSVKFDSPERVIAFRLSERSVSFFSSGSAELREPIQQLLAGQFQSIRRMTLEHGANHLEIVGYASPEASTRNDQDSNLDLSTQRAIAVTHFLGAKGVPYHCMSAVGMGRGRSDIISTLASTLASGTGQAEATRKWDELTRSAKGPAFTARLTNDLAEERRVEVVLTRDHASKCTQDELVAALNR